ncbi:MAG: hypothetical protein JWO44_534 [Bacteroidetes bacterium]|jgi:hypothetical protein|nr:hypothetical protein [Bacteroidota bacterium]
MKLFFCFAAILFIPVISFEKRNDDEACTRTKDSLVQVLGNKSLGFILGGSENDREVLRIWKLPKGQCATISIIKDRSIDEDIRFFAAEVMLENAEEIPADIDKADLGKLYAQALSKKKMDLNYLGMNSKDDLRYTGRHLLRIGKPAIPALATLLDNEEQLWYCCGSKASEKANALWEYRIKDVAAFFILKIRNKPFTWSHNPNKRDRMIKRLKRGLHGN